MDENSLIVDKFLGQNIYKKIWDLNCTVISILADLEHVLKYDKVVVLDHGKVVEHGNPLLLIRDKNSRLYEKLLQTD